MDRSDILPTYTLTLLRRLKNVRTIKTCSALVVTIAILSNNANQKMRCSVDCTVDMFLFSRVLKYFCVRDICETCELSFKTLSSIPLVCSAVVPAFCGNSACRGSFSICISKSTILSVTVDISLLKQNLYSPISVAVKTKSPCFSFVPSRTI